LLKILDICKKHVELIIKKYREESFPGIEHKNAVANMVPKECLHKAISAKKNITHE